VLAQPPPRRSALMISTTYRQGRRHGKHFHRGQKCCRQDRDGMRHQDESQHDSAVYRGTARGVARHLRASHHGCLVVRSAEAACGPRVVACNPRRNALLKCDNKDDRIDARKLSELLRGGQLQPVYHGEHGLRTLKELVRSYLTVGKDLARVMTCVTQIEIG
jgi:hypothetical protein